MKKILAKIGLVLVFTAVLATPVFAAVQMDPTLHPDYAPAVTIAGGTSADYGNYFLQLIAGGLLYLAAPITVLTIAVAGLRYVTSHGNQEAIDKAKKTLEFAIIGLIVIMLSYTIVRVAINTLLQTNTVPTTPTTNAPANPESSASPGGNALPGSGSTGLAKPGGK